MGSWYRVVKTIKGYRYVYEQRTWRDGKHVRTESRYIGPAGNGDARAAPSSGDGSVNTTRAVIVSTEVIEEVLADLLKPLQEEERSWEHGWDRYAKGENLVGRVPAADKVIAIHKPKWTHGLKGAFYNFSSDTINVPPRTYFYNTREETATQVYYGMLFHEFAHWTAHRSRLDRRPGVLWFGDKHYAREELVAEAAAIILMRHFEIAPENLVRHAYYFQHWLGYAGNREEALAYARREAERAVQFILGVNTT